MPRTKSSQHWLSEHFDDHYVNLAKQKGYRSRAVFKLMEMDEKEALIKPGMNIVDLGAAPGGWSQYAAERCGGKGSMIAVDLLPITPIAHVHCLQGDFREQSCLDAITAVIGDAKVDLVLSDMAPNMSGNKSVDIPRAMHLAELAYDFCSTCLKPGGNLLMKVFHGEGFDELLNQLRSMFQTVKLRKPKASRPRSRETYVLAKTFMASKLAP